MLCDSYMHTRPHAHAQTHTHTDTPGYTREINLVSGFPIWQIESRAKPSTTTIHLKQNAARAVKVREAVLQEAAGLVREVVPNGRRGLLFSASVTHRDVEGHSAHLGYRAEALQNAGPSTQTNILG